MYNQALGVCRGLAFWVMGWLLSGYVNPSVSKIDAGRTLYWTGTGDYCGYVGGKQIYYSSGTQHAELYVGKYA